MAWVRNIAASLVAVAGLLGMIPALILVGPFWLVSLLTHACAHLFQPAHVPWDELIAFEPIIGWKPKPNLSVRYLAAGDDVCQIRTDEQGWVGAHSLSESDIVVFGDSFAFSYGVNLQDSYIELNPGLKMKALAAPGYSMVQELLLMRQYAAHLTDKLVIWFICLENDLLDNIRPHNPNVYRNPFVRKVGDTANWIIETRHVRDEKWPHSAISHPYTSVFAQLFTPGPISDFIYASCTYLLKEGRDICQQVGGQLVILTIPNKNQLSQRGLQTITQQLENDKDFDPDFVDERFRSICDELSLPYIPLGKYLQERDYKINDPHHWTKRGHRRVSNVIAELFDTYKSGDLSSEISTF